MFLVSLYLVNYFIFMKQKNDFLKVAKKAALAGGRILLKEFKKEQLNTKRKSLHDLVSRADFLSENKILGIIKKQFPQHSFLSEETGRSQNQSDYLWIIDPLDGSINFAVHNPIFSISIALAYRDEVFLGLVYFPILNKLFTAEKNKGIFLNYKKIRVSNKKKIKDSLITFCSGYKIEGFRRAIAIYKKFKPKSLDLRQLGSGAIELAYVAAGYTEAIIIPSTNAWDSAAGALLVKEAGGQTTNFKGQNWTIKDKDIVASNGKIHQEILKLL